MVDLWGGGAGKYVDLRWYESLVMWSRRGIYGGWRDIGVSSSDISVAMGLFGCAVILASKRRLAIE